MSWTDIENALRAWVVRGSGLSTVDWSQQNMPRNEAPCISLRLKDPKRIGQDWLDIEDSDPVVAGSEITFFSRGQRTITLSMQCFSDDGTGASAAVMILDAVRSAVNLPTVRQAINDAGVGVGVFGPILSLDGAIGSGLFEPRAAMDVTLFLSSEISEFATYISSVEITNDDTGDLLEVP